MTSDNTRNDQARSVTLRKLLRAVWNNRSGMAATEFAMLIPLLVFLFFGTIELSDAFTANRRVVMAVNTVADLTAQSEELTPNEVDALIDGAMAILEPEDTSVVEVRITSVVLDADDDPIVHWSIDEDGNEPYAADDDFDLFTSVFQNNSNGLIMLKNRSVIFVELDFPYRPAFAQFFVNNPIQFKSSAKRAPRLQPRVQLCDNAGDNCTT
jgi:hypothetical protein